MAILKPEDATYHKKRKTTTLHFEDEGGTLSSSECIIRGGVCWPMAIREGGRERIEGYIVIIGEDVRSKIVTVYEETKYTCIDHITDKRGMIKYKGLSSWLNNGWTQYFCEKYYWRDRSATCERYMRDIRRSAMIKPKPQLPEVIWDEESEINHIMASLAMQGRLIADADGGFLEQQKRHMLNPDQPYPARHAMMCAIAGLDQYKWTRKDMDYD